MEMKCDDLRVELKFGSYTFETRFYSLPLFLGNYSGWKATCIGNNSSAAVSQLKQEYKEGEMTLKSALDLAINVLSKTLDMTKLSADKIEIATLSKNDEDPSKTKIRIMPTKELDELIKKYEAAEKAAEDAKKAAEADKP